MNDDKLIGFSEGNPVGLGQPVPDARLVFQEQTYWVEYDNVTNSLMHIGPLGRGMGAHWEYREDGSTVIHWHNGESMVVPAGENPECYAVAYLRSRQTRERKEDGS